MLDLNSTRGFYAPIIYLRRQREQVLIKQFQNNCSTGVLNRFERVLYLLHIKTNNIAYSRFEIQKNRSI